MKNTPIYRKYRSVRRKQNSKKVITKLIILFIFIQVSLTTIANITDLISSNIKYYELSRYMGNVVVMNDELFD